MECESRMRIKKEEQRHKATDAALIFFSAINLSPNQDRVGPHPHGSSKFTNLLQPIPRPWPWLMFYISSLSRHEPSSSWSPITRGHGAGAGGESSCWLGPGFHQAGPGEASSEGA